MQAWSEISYFACAGRLHFFLLNSMSQNSLYSSDKKKGLHCCSPFLKFKFLISAYRSMPARAETEEALDLSTNPGPEGMLAPGRSPAPVL